MDHIRRIRTGVGTAQPGSAHATASSATVDRSTVPVPRKWDAILTPPIEGQTTVEDMSTTRNPFRHRRSRGPAPGKGHYGDLRIMPMWSTFGLVGGYAASFMSA